MYNGKFNSKNTKRRLRWNKQFVLLVSILALVGGVVGGSLAYLIANTDSVENTFTPGNIDITVDEDFNGEVKKDVKIQNNGNVDAYIRAMIVVTWQDANGNVYGTQPVEGTDYDITWVCSGWSGSGNGWYTTTSAIAPGGETGILFTDCKPLKKAPAEGYTLVVDVIAEAIQADQKW